MLVHKKITVSGFVQGVSYRKQTLRVARRLGVTGWVRNMNDGTVEASFEGDPESVAAVIAWCAFGPPKAKVEEVTFVPVEDKGRYTQFDILPDRNPAVGLNLAA